MICNKFMLDKMENKRKWGRRWHNRKDVRLKDTYISQHVNVIVTLFAADVWPFSGEFDKEMSDRGD